MAFCTIFVLNLLTTTCHENLSGSSPTSIQSLTQFSPHFHLTAVAWQGPAIVDSGNDLISVLQQWEIILLRLAAAKWSEGCERIAQLAIETMYISAFVRILIDNESKLVTRIVVVVCLKCWSFNTALRILTYAYISNLATNNTRLALKFLASHFLFGLSWYATLLIRNVDWVLSIRTVVWLVFVFRHPFSNSIFVHLATGSQRRERTKKKKRQNYFYANES